MCHLLCELNSLLSKNINNSLIASDPRKRIKLSKIGNKDVENNEVSELVRI